MKEIVVIDAIIATQIESLSRISGTNPEIQKIDTTHTTNTKEEHITEDNKLLKIQIIKARIIFIHKGPKFTPMSKEKSLNLKSDFFDFTRRIQMHKLFYGEDYQNESLVFNKSNNTDKLHKNLIKI